MADYMEILRELREDSDLTRAQVAALGTTQQVYARYEKGINELPVRHLRAGCRRGWDVPTEKIRRPSQKYFKIL